MDEVFAKKLGEELKKLRIAHGYKQVDVAIVTNMTQPSYSLLELGKSKASIEALYRLAAYYGLTVDDIIKKCIVLDDEIFFNSQEPDYDKIEDLGYISFAHTKKYAALESNERELLFQFSKLGTDAKRELIEFAKFKRTQ